MGLLDFLWGQRASNSVPGATVGEIPFAHRLPPSVKVAGVRGKDHYTLEVDGKLYCFYYKQGDFTGLLYDGELRLAKETVTVEGPEGLLDGIRRLNEKDIKRKKAQELAAWPAGASVTIYLNYFRDHKIYTLDKIVPGVQVKGWRVSGWSRLGLMSLGQVFVAPSGPDLIQILTAHSTLELPESLRQDYNGWLILPVDSIAEVLGIEMKALRKLAAY